MIGASEARRAAMAGAIALMRLVLRRPALKMFSRRVLAQLPWLRNRVQEVIRRSAASPRVRLSGRVQDDADLSPRTVRMLRDLDRARDRKQPDSQL